jgi:cell division protein FtsL
MNAYQENIFGSYTPRTAFAETPVFNTPNPKPLEPDVEFVEEKRAGVQQPPDTATTYSAPKEKKFREKAQEKIESILNARTFLAVAGATVLLAFYIYNVIAINRLAGESEVLKKQIEDARSLNVELESKLKSLQRVEQVTGAAYEKLGLRYKTEPPVELKLEK